MQQSYVQLSKYNTEQEISFRDSKGTEQTKSDTEITLSENVLPFSDQNSASNKDCIPGKYGKYFIYMNLQ